MCDIDGVATMQAFLIAVFCCVTLDEFLVKTLDLPPILRFLPEAMSAVLAAYVLVAGGCAVAFGWWPQNTGSLSVS